VNASAVGGTGSYTFSGVGLTFSGSVASGVSAGTYVVVATDANGCTGSVSVTVGEPAAVVASATAIDALCNGGVGEVNASAVGGTGSYTFSGVGLTFSGSVASGVSAGTYVVVATDANGCTGSVSVTVGEPAAVVASATAVSATCATGTGTVTASATGGSGSYTFTAPGLTFVGNEAQNVVAGTYTITATDGNGCIGTTEVVVQLVATGISVSILESPALCGGNAGALEATVSGGVGPFAYLWNTNDTQALLTGLAPGSYSVVVTDANGCTASANGTVDGPSQALGLILTVTDLACVGNGASIQAFGGTPPYFYIWSNGDTTQSVSNLPPGVYSAGVADINGCLATKPFQIQNFPAIQITLNQITNASTNVAADGAIDLTVSGGQAPLSILWSSGATTEDLTGVSAGTYTITVTDAGGCVTTDEFVVGFDAPNCPYTLDIPADLNCGNAVYQVCLSTSGVQPGIIGLDIALTYPSALLTPVGTATPGPVAVNGAGGNASLVGTFVNANTPGVVNLQVFYQPNSPLNSALVGSGQVVCVDFTLNPNAPANSLAQVLAEVIESFEVGVNFACVEPGQANVDVQNILNGQLVYRNNNAFPLGYDANNPSAFNATTIEVTDAGCTQTLASFNPDVNGQFQTPILGSNSVRITRDIDDQACPSVTPAISSFDAYFIALIATKDVVSQPNFGLVNGVPTPSIYELLAADVNGDGAITAGDVTLMQQRIVLERCAFPGGRDWLFVDDDLITQPAFQPSATYPNFDGIGYDRFHVPAVPACLSATGVPGNGCPSFPGGLTYRGILVGDVDGSLTVAETANLRTASAWTLSFDASLAQTNGSEVLIPLHISGPADVKALDLQLPYATGIVPVGFVASTGTPADVKTLTNAGPHAASYLSVYSVQGFGQNPEHAYLMKVPAAQLQNLLTLDNTLPSAWVNGVKAGIQVRTTNSVATTFAANLTAYPNPATDAVTVSFTGKELGEVQIALYNAVGQQVFGTQVSKTTASLNHTIALTDLARGVYTLQVSLNGVLFTEKIVRN
jgi:hypothetical protein